MIKARILFLLFFLSLFGFSQNVEIAGTVLDSSLQQQGLKNAVVMAVKLFDSTLVKYTRTDANGFFKLAPLPVDTYQVIISHPSYGEKYFLVVANTNTTQFNFGKINMPPKNIELNEVVIYGYKEPVYYKGDTLIYTADSFKVAPNATVEDLVKKLPGMKVAADGKISFQGKQIDQVFVDGDEFFGTDPTIATKNLNANAIESVQVYDKQKEGEAANEEAVKVMNLKLKEEAKKGYFGKISGASDFADYYEGEVLANKFSNKQKISLFGLFSNTPRGRFDWNDIFTYGLNDEMNFNRESDDDVMFFSGRQRTPQGVPRTTKTGMYYSDKYGKNTKITSNYTYTNGELNASSQTSSQYFFPDTTYTVNNVQNSYQRNESHNVKITLTQKLDSLTELEITPSYKYTINKKTQYDNTFFYSDENVPVRSTDVSNTNTGQSDDMAAVVRLKKDFHKKDRKLFATYNFSRREQKNTAQLRSDEALYDTFLFPPDSINQYKNNFSLNTSNRFQFRFIEPLNQKIKLQLTYEYNPSSDSQTKDAFDFFNGDYTLRNDSFSNQFENYRTVNMAGLMFDYEVKKQRFYIGSDFRDITVLNRNIITGNNIYQNIKNILPYAYYRYKISTSASFDVRYQTSSSQPSIYQLQPVPDNTNPNSITIGNPNLLPTYRHRFRTSYMIHKPITGKYLWTNLSYNITNNAFSNKTYFDSLGRMVTQTVNVQGNNNGHFSLGATYPFFSGALKLQPDLGLTYNKTVGFVNQLENITQELGTNNGLDISLETKIMVLSIGGNYSYTVPRSTISVQSSKPYSALAYRAYASIKLPKKFKITSNADYTINSRRTQGYNIDFLIWNASVEKTFLKTDNLIFSVDATDILNQNINANRTVNDNVIVDSKTAIIGRYIMAKLIYKFNSNKAKKDEDIF